MARPLAAALLSAALPLGCAAAERTFTLITVNGVAPPEQQVLRVTRDDLVVMHFTSNKAGEIHLHGYRLGTAVVPATTATWRFTAHATGRYRLEFHEAGATSADHHGKPLATLEVMPK